MQVSTNSRILRSALALEHLPRGARVALAEIATLAAKTGGVLELPMGHESEVEALGTLIACPQDALPLFEPANDTQGPVLAFHDGERRLVIVNNWHALRASRAVSRTASGGRVGGSTSRDRMAKKRARDRAQVTTSPCDASHLTKSDGVTPSVTHENVTPSHAVTWPVTPNESTEKQDDLPSVTAVTPIVTGVTTAEPSRAHAHTGVSDHREDLKDSVLTTRQDLRQAQRGRVISSKAFFDALLAKREQPEGVVDGRTGVHTTPPSDSLEILCHREATVPKTPARPLPVVAVGSVQMLRNYRDEMAKTIQTLEFFDTSRDTPDGFAQALSYDARKEGVDAWHVFEIAVCDYRRAGKQRSPNAFFRGCFRRVCKELKNGTQKAAG